MIRLGENVEYVELYYTLRCNLRCHYCINGSAERKREQRPAWWYAKQLNEVNFRGIPLTIGGGEPTLRDDLPEFVNALRDDITVDLLTNGTRIAPITKIPPGRFTRRATPYKSIRISYHAGQSQQDLVENAYTLKVMGYPVGIFGIAHPANLPDNMLMAQRCADAGVFFFVKEFLGVYGDTLYGMYKYPDAIRQPLTVVQCRTSEILIDPEGDIYRCHRDLYSQAGAVANIGTCAALDTVMRKCENYGDCNLCDIKYKVAPDLKATRCSVEVQK